MQFLKYISGPLESFATWVLPVLFIVGLLLLPFLDRNPARRPSSRPVALLAGTAFLAIVFTLLGISIRDLHALPKLDPSVTRGKSLFAKNHCIACHGLHGEGGKVGPDLNLLSLKGSAAAPTEGRFETDETEYALLPYVGAVFSCLACVEAEERNEQI